jgi:hypothetical protein
MAEPVTGQSIVATGLPNPTRNQRQVFVAYPYTIYDKADYRRPFNDLSKAFNVTFVFADEKITTLHIFKRSPITSAHPALASTTFPAGTRMLTLELGLAYGLNEKAYIISNPKQHQAGEVPADLRGIDRIQYTSFAELQTGLEKILTQEFPIQPTHDVENQLTTLRNLAVEVISSNPEGLKVTDIADVLGVTIDVAKVVVYPLVGAKLKTTGVKKGTRYFAI